MKLVIVESPAKAKTIAKYLGEGYVVESSFGHVRDLPRRAADVPDSMRGEKWASLGVDIENDFKPLYVVSSERKQQISKLKKLIKQADHLYLATDEDREGEAIAWHLLEVLNPRVPVERMVFHEITKSAIEKAMQQTRDLDRRLVDAQEARRILDRLVGYEVSPVLWKMVRPKLSAGRVQSPAVRIVVERERERIGFSSGTYWSVEGMFEAAGEQFEANLVEIDGKTPATGRDFSAEGKVKSKKKVVLLDQQAAEEIVGQFANATATVSSVTSSPYRPKPKAPFRTSTLQQEASRKLRFSSARTMQVAQRLYENGYITYMRTDSVSLSETALTAARTQIAEMFGDEYLPDAPRTYSGKVKAAQEAHEAIRPAGESFRTPDEVGKASDVDRDGARLYELIWQRTVASQMADARGETVKVRLAAEAAGRNAVFGTSGRVIHFPGFLRVYVSGSDDPDADLEDRERRLPAMTEGQEVAIDELSASGHETKPPARFTEASLVKRLEELGIGRPSTYASIIQTIQDRGYVFKKGSALVPTWTAFAVVSLLEGHFDELVDYEFTARMESDLDLIASGEKEAIPWLRSFYFGNGRPGLHDQIEAEMGEIDARAVNSFPIGVDADGVPIVARSGRYGPYVERGEDTASIPEDIAPDELSLEKAVELLEAPKGDRVLGKDPESGLDVLVKNGRYGPYVQVGEMVEGGEKPKTASLFPMMDPETIDLEEALRLLSLPRRVGVDPETNEEIFALNGRYGPYLKREKDTRSLDNHDQIFSIDLDGALELFRQPKRRGRTTGPLRELGVDPEHGYKIEVRNGRFGPYVTDGGVNASLRKDDQVPTITLERALELLEMRREKLRAEGKEVKPGKA